MSDSEKEKMTENNFPRLTKIRQKQHSTLEHHRVFHLQESCRSKVKGDFLIFLRCTDVDRQTNASLDVLQEKIIDDNWNVDEDRLFLIRGLELQDSRY